MSDYKGVYIEYPPITWRSRHDPHVDDAEFRHKIGPLVQDMADGINEMSRKHGLKIVATVLAPDTWHCQDCPGGYIQTPDGCEKQEVW